MKKLYWKEAMQNVNSFLKRKFLQKMVDFTKETCYKRQFYLLQCNLLLSLDFRSSFSS